MIKIVRAAHGGDFKIELGFSTGEIGLVDLSELVQRTGSMVAPLRDPVVFCAFFLGATRSS